jgi:hypothetical protein
VPHAIAFRDLARLVDQDVERKPGLLDVPLDGGVALRDDGDDGQAAGGVERRPFCQFTEPAAAVGSPGAAMEREQDRPARDVSLKRLQVATIAGQRKVRRAVTDAKCR